MEHDRRANEKQHTVKVGDFFMSKYLVTIAQFERFVEEENYRADSGDKWKMDPYGKIQKDKQHPVANVSWNDAKEYCRWLSTKYNAEFRLPTEAQWEYACRAGTLTPFHTGENITTSQANYNGEVPYKTYPKGEYKKNTTPVGTYPPNPWGLYDMHGNVWEWCEDWYDENYGESNFALINEPMRVLDNPTGAVTGSNRVLRGGSWYFNGQYCRSAYRYGNTPDNRNRSIGFRLVFVP